MDTTPKPERPRTGRKNAFPPILMMAAGILLIAASIAMVYSQIAAGNSATPPLQIGQKLADFSLPDVSGNPVRLSDYHGKVVLVNFWATWCPPCRTEMPSLQAFFEANRSQGFVVLAINAGEAPSEVAAFAKNFQLTFPVLMDTQEQWVRRLGINDYPTSVIIGRDGKVKNIQIGLYLPEVLKKDVTPFLSQ